MTKATPIAVRKQVDPSSGSSESQVMRIYIDSATQLGTDLLTHDASQFHADPSLRKQLTVIFRRYTNGHVRKCPNPESRVIVG